jgi:hypothetical protein
VSTVFGASRAEQAGGVSLGQLSDVIERAKAYALTVGKSPDQVEPKVNVTFGGKIRKIEIEIED